LKVAQLERSNERLEKNLVGAQAREKAAKREAAKALEREKAAKTEAAEAAMREEEAKLEAAEAATREEAARLEAAEALEREESLTRRILALEEERRQQGPGSAGLDGPLTTRPRSSAKLTGWSSSRRVLLKTKPSVSKATVSDVKRLLDAEDTLLEAPTAEPTTKAEVEPTTKAEEECEECEPISIGEGLRQIEELSEQLSANEQLIEKLTASHALANDEVSEPESGGEE